MRKYSTVDYSTGEEGASDSIRAVTVVIIFYTSEHLSFPCSTMILYYAMILYYTML
jgi:hypothetical protein